MTIGKPRKKWEKRAVKDVPIFSEIVFKQLDDLKAKLKTWPYKTNPEISRRDKALLATLILVGPRASETKLQRKQFLIKESEVVTVNVETLKHGDIRLKVILPRTGALKDWTEILVEWLEDFNDPEAYLFPAVDAYGNFRWNHPLDRRRIWQIIKNATGLFPHWFRGVHETIYGRLVFKDDSGAAWKLKEHMGLKRLDSTTAYVRGEMEEVDRQRLKNLR